MKNRKLKTRVFAIAFAVFLYIVLLGLCFAQPVLWPYRRWMYQAYLFLRDISLPMLALPAVLMAYWLARYRMHQRAVRELLERLVYTVNEAIQYTYFLSPQHQDFVRVMTRLSVAIDSLPCVFENIEGNDSNLGSYPYENLRKIRHLVAGLGFCSESTVSLAADREAARNCIARMWDQMHLTLLQELDRDSPRFELSIDSPAYEQQLRKLMHDPAHARILSALRRRE